jgi:DNA polymerase I-like protein with 3'-5' exonuclease and polymerase domains
MVSIVEGELHDCQFAEALLQSDGLVNLDHLGEKYLGEGKQTNALYEWLAAAYGGPATQIQRENIWRAPPRLAGPYGEQDAELPIEVLEKQWPLLASQGLLDVYRMECDLIRLLVRMRLAGVTINLAAAEQLYDELAVDIANLYRELYIHVPIKIEGVNSPKDVAAIFDHIGIKYPRTEGGNPSFRKDWMKNLEHPIADLVNKIREYEKVRGTFLRNYILEGHTNGKIHCQVSSATSRR